MLENRKGLSPEQIKIVEDSFMLVSPEQMRDLNLSDHDVDNLCQQVSDAICQYNSLGHETEMLEKSREELKEQFVSGLSSFIIGNKDGEPIFLFHGSLYPMFKEGEEGVLGYQVVELGTAITRPGYQGVGLGQKGGKLRLEIVRQRRQGRWCLLSQLSRGP